MSALIIERADVIVASPGRNFVTLKITTSDGIVGWGDATLNGRELAVASCLSDRVELDEELAARYPYQAAYLPVNQLMDGTVHDW